MLKLYGDVINMITIIQHLVNLVPDRFNVLDPEIVSQVDMTFKVDRLVIKAPDMEVMDIGDLGNIF